MKRIKDLIGDYLQEGGLIIFGILLLISFNIFPNYQLRFWQNIQPYLQMACLIGSIISISMGTFLWTKHFKKIKMPRKYRLKKELLHKFILNNNCDVLYGQNTSVYDYSDFAKHIQEEHKPSDIFTICAFEPNEILNFILPRYNDFLRTQNQTTLPDIDSLESISSEDFLSQANGIFPHFKQFQLFNESSGSVKRILLLKDENAKKRNKKWMFVKFNILNGNIPCEVTYRNILEKQGLSFLTDFVVYDKKFIIDYYSDSNAFILSYIKSKNDPLNHLIKLINHWNNPTYKACYTNLSDYIRNF